MTSYALERLLLQMSYPGMPKPESNITRAWLRRHGLEYDSVEFNLRLGAGQDIQPGIGAATAAQFSKISRRRADIVATAGGHVDILEVKPTMSFAGVGQLLGYRHLWEETAGHLPVRRLIAIAQIIDQEVQRVMTAQGVTWEQVDPEVLT